MEKSSGDGKMNFRGEPADYNLLHSQPWATPAHSIPLFLLTRSPTSTITAASLTPSSQSLLLFSLISSFSSPQLGYTSLALSTGLPTSIGSIETPVQPLPVNVEKPSDFVLMPHGVVWVEKGTGAVKALEFAAGPNEEVFTKASIALAFNNGEKSKGPSTYIGLKDITLKQKNYLLALKENDAADLLVLQSGSGSEADFKVVWSFEEGDQGRTRSESIYSGYQGEKGLWATRMFWSHGLQVSAIASRRVNNVKRSLMSLGLD